MTRLTTGLNKALLLLLTLALLSCAASAAGTGTLHVINATGVAKDDTATVSLVLTNDYNPKLASLGLKIYYDSAVATAVGAKSPTGFTLPLNLSSPITVGGATTDGVENGDPIIVNVTFQSMKNDGSATDIGLYVQSARDLSLPPAPLTVSVINGTFKTKDEVAPVITLTTPVTVSSTFNIAGTITDVGGMGTAQATLKNATHTVPVALQLSGSAPAYTFSEQVTWPIEDGVTLTVTATDAAENTGTATQVINVVDVGFSKPEPTGYINAKPAEARVFMSQMNKGTVVMILGSATYRPIYLVTDTSTDYAKGTMPPVLPDGAYWVNASGIDNFGDARYLNWTFTLDTFAPVINSFTIADSDGDGYIEAGETLTLNWNVASDPSFDRVALVDVAKGDELWSSTNLTGTAAIPPIDDGNRDLAFRAYDKAGNHDSRAFHLYYNYMIWVNSTKMGEFSGIDTTYTAIKDISRTTISSITLYGCTVTLPTLDTLVRNVTNVGQVTNDTYVTVDNDANRTLTGSETYRKAWLLDPGVSLDFLVTVPHARNATLVLAEANETYIADLIKGGKGGMDSVNYTDLIRKTAYIFINGGWTKIVVSDNGTFSMPDQNGIPITNPGNISETLRHPDNQVDLNTGYRLNAQGLTAIKPASGDYVLAAIAMDGDRLGFLAAMPVMVMESDERVSIPSSVVQGGSITVSFNSSCDHLGVVLLRNVAYNGTALIDAATLGKDSLRLNLTYDGIPATQKLISNIYVSPSSGKYVVANTNKTTVSTSGLDAGDYRVYMFGQSAKGTIQAYEEGILKITPGGSIAVTSVPTGAAIYLDGVDTGKVTNGTLTAVPAGTHNVTVTLAGYAPKSSQVTVVAGQTVPAHFDLVPVGSIYVTSVPAGATIFLDNNNTGVVTNGTLTDIPAGNHTVMVKLAGYYDSTSSEVTVIGSQTATAHFNLTPAPTPTPTTAPYRGGGGSSGSTVSIYTGTGTLLTGSSGTVLKSVIVNAADNVGSMFVPIGTTALDANGKPLGEIDLKPLAGDAVPAVPSGSVFKFAGYAYEAGPDGATFDPAITLSLDIPEDVWNSLDLTNQQCMMKWYNKESGLWEDVPTTIIPGTRTVEIRITHFSIYALFTEPVTTPTTPTETVTTATPATPTTPTAPPAEGLSMTMILAIFAVIAIVVVAGYFLMMRK